MRSNFESAPCSEFTVKMVYECSLIHHIKYLLIRLSPACITAVPGPAGPSPDNRHMETTKSCLDSNSKGGRDESSSKQDESSSKQDASLRFFAKIAAILFKLVWWG